jgi:hypothetical protein
VHWIFAAAFERDEKSATFDKALQFKPALANAVNRHRDLHDGEASSCVVIGGSFVDHGKP